jgi:hypothetical protein
MVYGWWMRYAQHHRLGETPTRHIPSDGQQIGHFCQDYKQLFGELPSETIKRY